MSITPLGYILIPLGIVLFLRGTRSLFYSVVVTSSLFATCLITTELTLLRTPYYFTLLLIARKFTDAVMRRDFTFLKTRENLYLFLFLGVVIMSLIMPIIAQGKVWVIPIDSSVGLLELLTPALLELRLSNFTQAIYMLFFAASFLAFVSEIKSLSTIIFVAKGLVYSSVATILIGLIFQLFIITGNKYLIQKIYTITGLYDSRIFGAVILGEQFKMFTTTGEPGVTAFHCLIGLGILSGFILSKKRAFFGSRIRTTMLFLFLALGILLTGSSTGYYGIMLLVFAVVFTTILRSHISLIAIKRILRFLMIFFLMFIGLFFIIRFLTNMPLLDYFIKNHIEVLTKGERSGEIRAYLAIKNLQIFLQYPLLGIGYGSTRSLSMSTFLLANVGLLGIGTFYMFNFSIFKKGYIIIRNGPHTDVSMLVQGFLIAFIVSFLLLQFAQSESMMLIVYYWLLLAVLARCGILIHYRYFSLSCAHSSHVK